MDSKDISKRIRIAIDESGLSFVELERKTNIAKSSLQRYASGITQKIPVDAIGAIAEATGASAAWIMGWEDTEASNNKLSKAKQEFFEKVIQLDENTFRMVNRIVDSVLNESDE